MKKTVMTLAAASALGLASLATAGPVWDPSLDQTFLLNGGDLFTLDFVGAQATFTVNVAPSGLQVVGFSFSGVASGIDPIGAELAAEWTHLTITAPNGAMFTVGALGAGGIDAPWDFSGLSSENGLYRHGIGGDQWFGNGLPEFAFNEIPIGGEWTFTFHQQGFGGGIGWSDVQITLHSIPGPSGVALLAGIFLGRRRRRDGFTPRA